MHTGVQNSATWPIWHSIIINCYSKNTFTVQAQFTHSFSNSLSSVRHQPCIFSFFLLLFFSPTLPPFCCSIVRSSKRNFLVNQYPLHRTHTYSQNQTVNLISPITGNKQTSLPFHSRLSSTIHTKLATSFSLAHMMVHSNTEVLFTINIACNVMQAFFIHLLSPFTNALSFFLFFLSFFFFFFLRCVQRSGREWQHLIYAMDMTAFQTTCKWASPVAFASTWAADQNKKE